MRYAKNSLVVNPERDIPMLLQVRNSRFVSHTQLFGLLTHRGFEQCRSSFNWRTRRLLQSGHLSICEGVFGIGSPVYRITKQGLELLEHYGQFTTVLHSRTQCLPHPSQVFHSLELNNIQLALANQHALASWLSEIEIASFNTISQSRYQKDYDALVDVWIENRKVSFALEYERNLKSSKHYERIRRALEAERQVGCILYLTSGVEILVHLLHEFESLTSNIAFANAQDFGRLLLDTTVLTNGNASGIKCREWLQ